MIGIDTNVLVRFLTGDDPAQSAAAGRLIGSLSAERPGFVCREVTIELVWVLERAYRFGRREIAGALEGLLGARELVIEAAEIVGLALSRYARGGPGFADQMILAQCATAGCSEVVTFDRQAAGGAGGRLLETTPP
ncbi:putative nucleic-acid-binding protein [Palleronia aestuarii]|uniref:Ribonuclease VapC n=1 Tax=Palleronia aestuarii TaxID=568105 RepID=A0A2W7N9S5_9RHOB|nr:type II toxin-antitoxin system VapC family toxin [Palleronia aestuarii]PZX14897.1 putative nucleic-acid-binding protein [Palleronia aestuarii]